MTLEIPRRNTLGSIDFECQSTLQFSAILSESPRSEKARAPLVPEPLARRHPKGWGSLPPADLKAGS